MGNLKMFKQVALVFAALGLLQYVPMINQFTGRPV